MIKIKNIEKIYNSYWQSQFIVILLIQRNEKEVIPIENYIISKIMIVIGLLFNGNIEQAIADLEDVIAYLEEYKSNK